MAGKSKLKCLKTPPLGSENNKFLNLGFLIKNSDFSAIVFPFGFSTPETITSPTSPAAGQPTVFIKISLFRQKIVF